MRLYTEHYLFIQNQKTVINSRYYLEDAFNELINRITQWTNKGSGWIIDETKGLYIDTANYEPLSGSSYIQLPKELNNSKKDLINIENKDLKCFMWCHIRLINPTDSHPEWINKKDKEIASFLDYSGIDFPIKTHHYELTENIFEINVNLFGYENKVYPLYISEKSDTLVLNVLLITKEEKPHYVFIKDFDRLMYSKAKTKNANKNIFVSLVYKIPPLKKYVLIIKKYVY